MTVYELEHKAIELWDMLAIQPESPAYIMDKLNLSDKDLKDVRKVLACNFKVVAIQNMSGNLTISH